MLKAEDLDDAEFGVPPPSYVMVEVEKYLELRENQAVIPPYTMLKHTLARLSEITRLLASGVYLDTRYTLYKNHEIP